MTTEDKIRKQLADNPIILYMKGIPSDPQCGFSGKTVGILNASAIPFAFVNVLEAPFIREKLPKLSKWPTFPQLFVKGELVGGCDIVEAMDSEGSLLPLLKSAIVDDQTQAVDTHVITHAEVEQLIKNGFPDATVLIEGEGCNLSITVISQKFQALPLVKKQQGVMAVLTEALASGRLHAVTLKTYTPEEWGNLHKTSVPGLLQIQL
ncbi:MAG: Grx4 family monothiol glutaredoxin [Methylicorpusculum sp.]|nr:Grx4 family monothiol glutaredoxin [Methylicorpusculum sp.]